MQLKPFLLDAWLGQYQHDIEFNLAASTGPTWTVNDILACADDEMRHRFLNHDLVYSAPAARLPHATVIADLSVSVGSTSIALEVAGPTVGTRCELPPVWAISFLSKRSANENHCSALSPDVFIAHQLPKEDADGDGSHARSHPAGRLMVAR
jgi:hypothetical protein